MNIPTKLKIGGHVYKVEIVDDSSLCDNDTCGKLDRSTNTISISKTLSDSSKSVTLLHEAIHAMNGELSEEVIDSLSEQLYQLLKDNQLYFK